MNDMAQKVCQYVIDSADIKAAVIVGSQARVDFPADEYSDLDIIIITAKPECFLHSDEWLKGISDYHVSFIENTLFSAKERRVLFDNGNDIDFIILNEQQAKGIQNHEADEIFVRGYKVIKDEIGISNSLGNINSLSFHSFSSNTDFNNAVNDFWFHCVWTAKKILRGELLTAKSCLDIYMKQIVLRMIEDYTYLNNSNCDVWYNGRFIEKWADKKIIEMLRISYAKYNEKDMINALYKTMELFKFVSEDIAKKKSFTYPEDAEIHSYNIIKKLFSGKEVSQ